MANIIIAATINPGASLRIGYRVKNSSNPFTYLSVYPTSVDLPYTITGLGAGFYEVELTQICPNCSGGVFSDPIIMDALSQ
jgi:hypothetical protein